MARKKKTEIGQVVEVEAEAPKGEVVEVTKPVKEKKPLHEREIKRSLRRL